MRTRLEGLVAGREVSELRAAQQVALYLGRFLRSPEAFDVLLLADIAAGRAQARLELVVSSVPLLALLEHVHGLRVAALVAKRG